MKNGPTQTTPNPSNEGTLFLQEAFASEQVCLEASLRSSNRIRHQGDKGEVNEQFFIDFLRCYLPNRYTIEKATVIDSHGRTSDSIDVVVFDRQYTPTLLDSEKHRYVPAESVYAVFECKPTINKTYLDYAGDKAASVRKLYRTSLPVPHAAGTHPPKPLHHIVAGILAIDVEWSDGLSSTFTTNLASLTADRQLDCGFAAKGESFDIFDGAGQHVFGPPRNALAFFAFRLLSRLQAIATVPVVDWGAYAKQLSKIISA